jgi:hypothetical protein
MVGGVVVFRKGKLCSAWLSWSIDIDLGIWCINLNQNIDYIDNCVSGHFQPKIISLIEALGDLWRGKEKSKLGFNKERFEGGTVPLDAESKYTKGLRICDKK